MCLRARQLPSPEERSADSCSDYSLFWRRSDPPAGFMREKTPILLGPALGLVLHCHPPQPDLHSHPIFRSLLLLNRREIYLDYLGVSPFGFQRSRPLETQTIARDIFEDEASLDLSQFKALL